VAERRGHPARYEPSKSRITWPDLNAWATTFSAEEPDQLRGPQFHTAWADEVGAWDPNKVDDIGNTAWTNLKSRMRLGTQPRVLVTTTPKRTAIMKDLNSRAEDPLNHVYVITRSSSLENAANLAPSYLDDIVSDYEGTRLYEQEILGIMLDDEDLTLWNDALIAACHRLDNDPDAMPKIVRKVVAVDPPGKDGGDECGIIAVGMLSGPLPGQLATKKRSVVVLADRSLKGTSEKWARQVHALCEELDITRITYENNKVGDAVETIIRNLSSTGRYTFDPVFATDSKYLRAEPVSQLYEQHRVAHAKDGLDKLEKQMLSFQVDMRDSPDRVDALVHAITNLLPSINTTPVTMGVSNRRIESGPAVPRPAPISRRPALSRTLAGLDTSHYRDIMGRGRKAS
jgi:phage terminase large subunit-like protein